MTNEQATAKLMSEGGLSREEAKFGAGFLVEIEKMAAAKQQRHFETLSQDMGNIAQRSARMLDVMQRTSCSWPLSKQEAQLLEELMSRNRSCMHELSRLTDDFFAWHNLMVRLAKSRE